MKKDLTETLSTSFLDYAAYTIQRRAIPDVRDGLKFSARQLLHALWHEGVVYNKPFKKGSKVAGLATFSYCHGDASAYGSYVRMAKPFSNNVCLMEGQGNVGTLINPDDHASSRYLELREAKVTSILFQGLKKNTITEWEDTYDNLDKFPLVLPSIGYWNICNPCQGIATSCATSIPGFNLREVNSALVKLIKNPEIDFDEIYCPPDFPTGATVTNGAEVKESIRKGQGSSCRIRATINYDAKHNALVVSEIPYSVFTNTICRQVNELISENENYGIEKVADYTGEKCNIEFELSKNANPAVMIQKLYKDTSLESHFSINMIMLDHGRFPKVFGWREACQAYIDHIRECKKREVKYDYDALMARNHILEGLLIAIAHIDEVVALIRKSKDSAEAKSKLKQNYGLDDDQAKAILDLKLQRLANLEAIKVNNEYEQNRVELDRLNAILTNSTELDKVLIEALEEVAKEFGDARRTKITNTIGDEEEEEEEVPIIVRVKDGKIGIAEKNLTGTNLQTTNKETLIAFAADGKMAKLKVKELTDKMVSLNSIFKLKDVAGVSTLSTLKSGGTITFITEQGYVKRTNTSDYSFPPKASSTSMKLQEGDKIKAIDFEEKDRVELTTEDGKSHIFYLSNVSATGRAAKGKKLVKDVKIKTVKW